MAEMKEFWLQGVRFKEHVGAESLHGEATLYITTNRKFVPVTISHLACAVDYIAKREEVRHPRPFFQGHEMLLSCMRQAAEGDWVSACQNHGLEIPRTVLQQVSA